MMDVCSFEQSVEQPCFEALIVIEVNPDVQKLPQISTYLEALRQHVYSSTAQDLLVSVATCPVANHSISNQFDDALDRVFDTKNGRSHSRSSHCKRWLLTSNQA